MDIDKNQLENSLKDLKFAIKELENLHVFNRSSHDVVQVNEWLKMAIEKLNTCKVLGEKYGNHSQECSATLSTLFKVVYQQIKGLIECLVGVEFSLSVDCQSKQVLEHVSRVGFVIFTMDVIGAVNMWKLIKRFYLSKKVMIEEIPTFNITTDITNIITEVLSNIMEEQIDVHSLEKLQKCLRFFIGVFMSFIKDVRSAPSTSDLHALVCISTQVSRCLMVKHPASSEFRTFILTLSKALVSEIVLHVNSIELLHQNILKSNAPPMEAFHILQIVNELTNNQVRLKDWILTQDNKMSVLNLIFECIDKLEMEIFTSKMMPLSEHSYYDEMLIKTCALVANIGQEEFCLLEEVLLQNVLSTNYYKSLFASDVWCFVARWGSSTLCWNHFKYIGYLITQLSDSTRCLSLISLFKRVYYLLDDKYQVDFFKEFPIYKSNLAIWKLLPLSHLKSHFLNNAKVFQENIEKLTEVCLSLVDGEHIETGAIKCLSNICANQDIYTLLLSDIKSNVEEFVVNFWMNIIDEEVSLKIQKNALLSMLELTTSLINNIDTLSIATILKGVTKTTACFMHVSWMVMVCRLLLSIKYVQFHFQIEESCLMYMRKVFHYLLVHNHFVVRCSAMKTLKEFAECTIYTKSVQHFLPANAKKGFGQYLKKVINSPCTPEEIIELLKMKGNEHQSDRGITKEDRHNAATIITDLHRNVDVLKNAIENEEIDTTSLSNNIKAVIKKLQIIRDSVT